MTKQPEKIQTITEPNIEIKPPTIGEPEATFVNVNYQLTTPRGKGIPGRPYEIKGATKSITGVSVQDGFIKKSVQVDPKSPEIEISVDGLPFPITIDIQDIINKSSSDIKEKILAMLDPVKANQNRLANAIFKTSSDQNREQISNTAQHIHLEIILVDNNGSPILNQPCEYIIDGLPPNARDTNNVGILSIDEDIPINSRIIEVRSPGLPKASVKIEIKKLLEVESGKGDAYRHSKDNHERLATAIFKTPSNQSREQISNTEQHIHLEIGLVDKSDKPISRQECEHRIDGSLSLIGDTDTEGILIVDENIPINSKTIEIRSPGLPKASVKLDLKKITEVETYQGEAYRKNQKSGEEEKENNRAKMEVTKKGSKCQISANDIQINDVEISLKTPANKGLEGRNCRIYIDGAYRSTITSNNEGLMAITGMTIPLESDDIEVRFIRPDTSIALVNIPVKDIAEVDNAQSRTYQKNKKNGEDIAKKTAEDTTKQQKLDAEMASASSNINRSVETMRIKFFNERTPITNELTRLTDILDRIQNPNNFPKRDIIQAKFYGEINRQNNLGLDFSNITEEMLVQALQRRITQIGIRIAELDQIIRDLDSLIALPTTSDLNAVEIRIRSIATRVNFYDNLTEQLKYIKELQTLLETARQTNNENLNKKNKEFRKTYNEFIECLIKRYEEYNKISALRNRLGVLQRIATTGRNASNELRTRSQNRVLNKMSQEERSKFTQEQTIGQEAERKIANEGLERKIEAYERDPNSLSETDARNIETSIREWTIILASQNPDSQTARFLADIVIWIPEIAQRNKLTNEVQKAQSMPSS